MKKIRSILILLLSMISGLAAAQPVEMADGLRANGKIYIVVIIAAMVISITGMYIISIDRKLTRLEKKISNK